MSNWNWFSRSLRPRVEARRSRAIAFETLEDRATPAVVDLTTVGASGVVNGAIFQQFSGQQAQTGDIDPFVRLQAKGCNLVEQGYNTDARKLQFDENKDRDFTRAVQLKDFPKVTIDGVAYREIMLDVNEKSPQGGWKKGSKALISLDELRIFVGNSANLSGYNTLTDRLAGMKPVYDLDAGTGWRADNWIKLDNRLNTSGGKGDMLAHIPESVFGANADNKYIYLYSKFGVHHSANAGFESWCPGPTPPTPPANSGSISGTVINSASGAGAPALTVYLDSNGNGMFDENERSTATDANGHFEFDNLPTGPGTTYLVSFLSPGGVVNPSSLIVSLDEVGQNAIDVNFTFEPVLG